MLQLVVAEVQQIFLVYVSLAILSYYLDVVKIEGGFCLVLQDFVNEWTRLVLTPEKRENFIYYVGLEIFMGVAEFRHLDLEVGLSSLRTVASRGGFLHKMIVMFLITFIIQKTWVWLRLIYWQCLLLQRWLRAVYRVICVDFLILRSSLFHLDFLIERIALENLVHITVVGIVLRHVVRIFERVIVGVHCGVQLKIIYMSHSHLDYIVLLQGLFQRVFQLAFKGWFEKMEISDRRCVAAENCDMSEERVKNIDINGCCDVFGGSQPFL